MFLEDCLYLTPDNLPLQVQDSDAPWQLLLGLEGVLVYVNLSQLGQYDWLLLRTATTLFAQIPSAAASCHSSASLAPCLPSAFQAMCLCFKAGIAAYMNKIS